MLVGLGERGRDRAREQHVGAVVDRDAHRHERLGLGEGGLVVRGATQLVQPHAVARLLVVQHLQDLAERVELGAVLRRTPPRCPRAGAGSRSGGDRRRGRGGPRGRAGASLASGDRIGKRRGAPVPPIGSSDLDARRRGSRAPRTPCGTAAARSSCRVIEERRGQPHVHRGRAPRAVRDQARLLPLRRAGRRPTRRPRAPEARSSSSSPCRAASTSHIDDGRDDEAGSTSTAPTRPATCRR